MTLNLSKLFRAGVVRPIRGSSVPDIEVVRPSRRLLDPIVPVRPALLVLGTRGVPAAHGGFETFAEKFALHMVDRGWNVTVYCQRDVSIGSPLDGTFDVDNWRGIRRVFVSVSGGGPRSTMNFDWRCVLHARTQPGIALILGYNTACFLPLLRIQGRPILTNMDGIEWKRQKWPPAIKGWFFVNEIIGCMTSTALVADHPEIYAHLKIRCSASKIFMIPYGADRIETANPRNLSKYSLTPNGFAVSIARIEPENSILEIVRSFSRRRRRYSLVCVGALDPGRNSYHERVKAAAGNQVLFPGAIYDKETIASIRHYALAYLHGHTVGGTNPSLVEALGAGNAIIARRNKFNAWTAGPDQLYFSSEDECDVLLEQLVDDHDTVNRAREAAALRHQQFFTWSRVLESYEILCSRLAKSRLTLASMVLAAILTCFHISTARCEYVLGPGDRLEIAVSGSIRNRATINADGQIAMPQVGSVTLAGLSLAAAQNRLQDEYRVKRILLNADVLLEVVEYRPFYISGDVARAGAYAFQPNITVRHAVALAGGFDTVRFRFGENPFTRAADLRNEYETLAVENLRAQLRQRRLQAEIGGKSDADFGYASSFSVSPAIFEEAVRLERQQLEQRAETLQKDTASLKAAITSAQENLDTLVVERRSESDNVKHEEDNLTVMGSNVAKGLSSANRLTEQQRDLAAARSRYMASQLQIWSARRNIEELQRQLDRIDENHRSALLTELQDASLALEKIKSQIKAVAEKFAAIGGARSALYMRPGNEADVTIFRRVNGRIERLQATADTDVLAGDVVEIDLKPGRLLGMAAVSPETDARSSQ